MPTPRERVQAIRDACRDNAYFMAEKRKQIVRRISRLQADNENCRLFIQAALNTQHGADVSLLGIDDEFTIDPVTEDNFQDILDTMAEPKNPEPVEEPQ